MNAPAPAELLKRLKSEPLSYHKFDVAELEILVNALEGFDREHRRYLDASRRADDYRKERDAWKLAAHAEAEIGKRQAASVGAEVAGEAVAWRHKFQEWQTWSYSTENPNDAEQIVEPLYASPSRSEGVSKGEVQSGEAWSCGTCGDADVPEKFRVFGSCYRCAAQRSIDKRNCKIEQLKAREVNAALGAAQEAVSCGEPVAWIVKWATVHTPKNASAYLNEKDAQRAAANVKMYADASDVVVIPTYAARPTIPNILIDSRGNDIYTPDEIGTSSVPSAECK